MCLLFPKKYSKELLRTPENTFQKFPKFSVTLKFIILESLSKVEKLSIASENLPL